MSAHTIFYKKLSSKNSFFYIFCLICACVVAANIFYSQKYNPQMYGVMQGDSSSIISYLKHIWGTPLFTAEVNSYREQGRSDVLLGWNEIQQKNMKRIRILEEATTTYSLSPELYYNLYLLYRESGNAQKAQENLLKAQKIDPSIQ